MGMATIHFNKGPSYGLSAEGSVRKRRMVKEPIDSIAALPACVPLCPLFWNCNWFCGAVPVLCRTRLLLCCLATRGSHDTEITDACLFCPDMLMNHKITDMSWKSVIYGNPIADPTIPACWHLVCLHLCPSLLAMQKILNGVRVRKERTMMGVDCFEWLLSG